MTFRPIATLLVAGTICSLASADVGAQSNPKTRAIQRQSEAGKETGKQQWAGPKAQFLQQKLALLGQPNPALGLGGTQSASPIGYPTTLALNGSDSCATPDPISGTGTYAFNNTTATTGTQGQNESLCLAYGYTAIANDVWFVWVAPSSGTATMTLCGGTNMDSKIAAYAGTTCPFPGTALACNDDFCVYTSAITFPVTGGNSYMLQLGNYHNAAGSSGTFDLSIAGSGPANDSCATPTPISGLGTFGFDNTSATTGTQGQTEALCLSYGLTSIANDIWFAWTAPSSGTATMTLCNGTGMDSKIAAYAGSSCPAAGSALACNDDSCGVTSAISFPVSGGNSYLLQLGNYTGASGSIGSFDLGIVTGGPSNDDCTAAIPISGSGPWVFDTTGATTSVQQSGSCGTAGQDIWYDWTATATGTATLSLCGSSFDSIAAVYPGGGCPGAGTVYCNDDFCGLQSQVNFPCSAGSLYALQIGAYNAGSGPGTFTINVAPGTPNDDCSSPTAIAGTGVYAFDNTGATTGTQGQTEPLCLFFGTTAINNDIWFAWTAPTSGTATWTLCGLGGIDSKIAAYAGSGCPTPGSALACNDDTCAYESEVSFQVLGGSTYLLQLGNYAGATGGNGFFSLTIGPGSALSYLCDPGSGGVIGCPCSNPPAGFGQGCDNSAGTGGASITGAGFTALASPTLAFTTAGEKPTATTILLQGSSAIAAGVTFGQGVRCAGGSLKRLYARTAVGGSVTLPDFSHGDLDIPTRSAALGDPISAGQSRWYMAYYRDPIVLGGCSAFFTFNGTNTARADWQ